MAIPRLSCSLKNQEVRPGNCTKIPRNVNMEKVQHGYLFPEIDRHELMHKEKYPHEKVIDLGIGDTTEPLPTVITSSMVDFVHGTIEGYKGYGPEQGEKALRKAIADAFYKDLGILPVEVFVSDGAQCEITCLQLLLGSNVKRAIQDPSLPVQLSLGDL